MDSASAAIAQELSRLGGSPDESIDLGDAALVLAAHRHPPGGDLEPYRRHLRDLAERVAQIARPEAAEGDVDARVEALNQVLIGQCRYAGDERDYDNLDNADLTCVIDRRRGLPVTLGILYLQTARRQNWQMVGLNFPAHFLVRLDSATGQRAILDPFHGGLVLDASGLRDLLKSVAGAGAELEPQFYSPVSNRDILVRLQNNIKLRLLRQGLVAEALKVVEGMLLFAPDQVMLWREAGMMSLRLDDVKAAISALDQFVARAPNSPTRHRVSVLLQDLRGRLH